MSLCVSCVLSSVSDMIYTPMHVCAFLFCFVLFLFFSVLQVSVLAKKMVRKRDHGDSVLAFVHPFLTQFVKVSSRAPCSSVCPTVPDNHRQCPTTTRERPTVQKPVYLLPTLTRHYTLIHTQDIHMFMYTCTVITSCTLIPSSVVLQVLNCWCFHFQWASSTHSAAAVEMKEL